MSAVGVTASRHGLTPPQRKSLGTWLRVLRRAGADAFHHGDCVGGDEQGAQIARDLGYRIIAHPPTSDHLRANFVSDEVRPPLPYLDRNKNIVSETDVLFACPAEAVEQAKGGTWWTVRYARQVNAMYADEIKRPVIVITPAGEVID